MPFISKIHTHTHTHTLTNLPPVRPTSAVSERIEVMQKFLVGLRKKRDEIVNILMWEICKTAADSAKEVDRTIK